jgi:effector-binding domain-containing protein
MSLKEAGIVHKSLGDTLVATIRRPVHNWQELRAILDEVARAIPEGVTAGPAFCIYHWISSVTDGQDGEAGFPVSRAIEAGDVRTRVLPAMEVLSLAHKGPADGIGETYTTLFRTAARQGIISDEFMLEVYPDSDNLEGSEIEVRFVLHDWVGLLGSNLERVLGAEAAEGVVLGSDAIALESTVDDRFCWIKGAMERLDGMAGEHQKYDAVSGCAHVFPRGQIAKLTEIYESARMEADDPLAAVDAVLEFMDGDPGWGEPPRREGRAIYTSKKPRDPKGYESAKDDAERRKAYCFCPLVRNHLEDGGMPVTFCYCGAGWYRQQWEGAIGKPVRVEIVESLLKGDDRCTFAVYLPEDL